MTASILYEDSMAKKNLLVQGIKAMALQNGIILRQLFGALQPPSAQPTRMEYSG